MSGRTTILASVVVICLGMASALAGNVYWTANADHLCFGALQGDATGDGVVNLFDLVTIRNNLGLPVAPPMSGPTLAVRIPRPLRPTIPVFGRTSRPIARSTSSI